ncbi:MAG: endonuclease Q family protein [Firmicutes bacterium]|nr:endonuclease Q family protein [Bacillota bacterium]
MLLSADLHVHLGRDASGHPVKIPASARLTLEGVVARAREVGLDAVGVVEGHNPCLRRQLQEWVQQGRAVAFREGFWLPEPGLVLLLGMEMELALPPASGRRAHYVWFPEEWEDLPRRLDAVLRRLKNPCLSTPLLPLDPAQVAAWGGVFFPAHAFTPFRGALAQYPHLYPPGVRWLELGLSANTEMANAWPELSSTVFLTHSDAHSLSTVGREFTLLDAPAASPQGVLQALAQGAVLANVGLPPALGKYHAATCRAGHRVENPQASLCPQCGAEVVRGVAPLLAERAAGGTLPWRPPYRERVMLAAVPGLGASALAKVLASWREIAAREVVAGEWFDTAVRQGVGERIRRLRAGEGHYELGGGGRYGRIRI